MGNGPKFNLSEAMINKKHLNKAREDLKKIKEILSEMQIYVQEHQVKIQQELINQTTLNITTEMLEEQTDEKVAKEIQKLEDRLRPKLKKRIKMTDIDSKLLNKVNMIDFMKQIERIDNTVQVFADKVDHKLPAIEF